MKRRLLSGALLVGIVASINPFSGPLGRMLHATVTPFMPITTPATEEFSEQKILHETEHPLPDEFTVLSYNMARARNRSSITSLRDVLDSTNPDVLLLQEAPNNVWEEEELVHYFAGKSVLYTSFHERDSASYGQVLATAYNVKNVATLLLPTVNARLLQPDDRMRRVALRADVQTSTGLLRIINAHNEPFTYPRLREHQFRPALDDLQKTPLALYTGDLNAWGLGSEKGERALVAAGFTPALIPGFRVLDNSFSRGIALLDAASIAKPGSDHTPLLLRYSIPATQHQ